MFSYLIEFCLKLELPDDDNILKAFSFVVFQIYDPHEIRKGVALRMFEESCLYLKDIESKKNSNC